MFLLINKPKGITSHDVVNRLRRITGIKKVGHAGTLDPNATGLLIVGIGKESTKKLGIISKDTTKSYLAEIALGEERNTDDIEGKVVKSSRIKPNLSEIKTILESFRGKIDQTPPQFSAIKLAGQTAYKVARKGGELELTPRRVVIHKLELVEYQYPYLNLNCEVSSGTYIRSLARDIGRSLGCLGYLNNLKRTAIGNYYLKEAVDLESLGENWQESAVELPV